MTHSIAVALASTDEALLVLQDAIAANAWIVAGIAFVLLVVPLVLKALGKTVPFLDPLVEVAIAVLKKFAPKKEPKPIEGAASVVKIERDDK